MSAMRTLDALELRGAHCIRASDLRDGDVIYQGSDPKRDYVAESVRCSACGHFITVTTNDDTMTHVYFADEGVYVACKGRRP